MCHDTLIRVSLIRLSAVFTCHWPWKAAGVWAHHDTSLLAELHVQAAEVGASDVECIVLALLVPACMQGLDMLLGRINNVCCRSMQGFESYPFGKTSTMLGSIIMELFLPLRAATVCDKHSIFR